MSAAPEFDALDADLAGEPPDFGQPAEAPPDADRANQLLRHVARLRRERRDIVAVHEAEVARIRGRLKARVDVIDGQERWFLDALAGYHRALLAADRGRKTVHLPAGTLKARAQQKWWDIDRDEFVAWAEGDEARVGMLRLKMEPDRDAVKDRLEPVASTPGEPVAAVDRETGEVVPGVTVTAREPKFTVDTDDTP